MDLDQEKNEKFLHLVEKYDERFDQMGYEFYDLDTPSLSGKIEQAVFIFEILEMNHLLDSNTKISEIKEYLPGLFKKGKIDGFTFLRDEIPYYIPLTGKLIPEGYKVIPFGKTKDKELIEKENKLIEIFELFQDASSVRDLYHIE